MVDREPSRSSKRETDQKQRRDFAGKIGQSHGAAGDLVKERERGTSGGTVGRDVPDMSKEHSTEVAIEAGRKGKHPEDKP